jgi:membrane-associated protease RseP (regulator of RpoE activity)
MFLLVMVLIFAVTVPHELAHFFVATKLGIRVLRLIVGIAKGKPLIRSHIGQTKLVVYKLPLVFAIEPSNKAFALASGWRRSAVGVAGPVANVLMVLIPAVIILGPEQGTKLTLDTLAVSFQVLGAFLFGWVGMFGGSQVLLKVPDLLSGLAATYGLEYLVIAYFFLQAITALINLLPIPGMDGGWVVLSVIIRLRTLGQSGKKKLAMTGRTYIGWTKFTQKYLILIIIFLIPTLFVIHAYVLGLFPR